MGCWLGTRVCLDTLERRKISAASLVLAPDHAACSLVTIPSALLWLLNSHCNVLFAKYLRYVIKHMTEFYPILLVYAKYQETLESNWFDFNFVHCEDAVNSR